MQKNHCVICGKTVATFARDLRLCSFHMKCIQCGDRLSVNEERVTCSGCGSSWSSEELKKILFDKHHRITCPYCKGRGTIQASKESDCWDLST